MPDREQFSEAEVRAILKRAAERQHHADLSAEAREAGLSLEELERVAASAGIEARHVRAALYEAQRGSPGDQPAPLLDRIVGAPTRIHLERSVTGRLDDALWQKIVVELRRTFSTPGILGDLGTIREWRSNPSVQDQAEIQAEEVDGRIRLTLRRSWKNQAAGPIGAAGFLSTFAMMLVVIGAAADKMAKISPLVLFFLVFGALLFGGARLVFPRWTRQQTRRFTTLMDRLERVVEEHEGEAVSAVGTPASEPERAATTRLGDMLSDDMAEGSERSEASRPTRTRA